MQTVASYGAGKQKTENTLEDWNPEPGLIANPMS